MAWSRAAAVAGGKASAAVRRAHAAGKKYAVRVTPGRNASRFIGKEYRQGLAGILRDMRKHGVSNTADLKVPRLAAISTRFRNGYRLAARAAAKSALPFRAEMSRAQQGGPGPWHVTSPSGRVTRTNMWTAQNATNPHFMKRGY